MDSLEGMPWHSLLVFSPERKGFLYRRRYTPIACLPTTDRVAYLSEYPQRREFQNSTIVLKGASAVLREKLTGIGFCIAE